MNRKWSHLGKHRFYNIEEAVELLTNMSDCEDDSTSEMKMKVILLTLLKMHQNNIRLELIQIF